MFLKLVFSFILLYLLPIILILLFPQKNASVETVPISEEVMYIADITEPEKSDSSKIPSPDIMVSVLTDDGISDMYLESYICGVVLAEMPAEFEIEALKAQAVVARTYTCRSTENPKHNDAQICTDSSCCQAYISEANFQKKGGTQEQIQKVKGAVYDTKGQVLRYNGQYIEATYFSCSGGRTEDALAVWGTDVPYLQSVESPGEENAAHYKDEKVMSIAEFSDLLGITLSGSPSSWIGTVIYTEGGGVSSVMIGGYKFSGTEIRKKLGLKSTAFSIVVMENTVMLTTKGYGHRVGMSQYGAEAMAVQGRNYREILSHYYQGAILSGLLG